MALALIPRETLWALHCLYMLPWRLQMPAVAVVGHELCWLVYHCQHFQLHLCCEKPLISLQAPSNRETVDACQTTQGTVQKF